jgi:hypothetical protein
MLIVDVQVEPFNESKHRKLASFQKVCSPNRPSTATDNNLHRTKRDKTSPCGKTDRIPLQPPASIASSLLLSLIDPTRFEYKVIHTMKFILGSSLLSLLLASNDAFAPKAMMR